MGALARCGQLDAPIVADALTDPESRVRRRAVELAIAHPTVDLSAALEDADPSVVDVACWACGERETVTEAEFAALITVATEHDDPICRESAIAALGAIADPRAVETIIVGTSDKPAVRRRAALALAPFDDDSAVEALRRLSQDRDWQVRQAVEDLLGPTEPSPQSGGD